EGSLVERQQVCGSRNRHGGVARLVEQERRLTEDLARLDPREQKLAAPGPPADLELSTHQDEEAVTALPLANDHRPLFERGVREAPRDLLQIAARQSLEESSPGQPLDPGA